MKLEYLEDMTDEGKFPDSGQDPIMRLYDFDPNEASLFRDTIQKTVIDGKGELDLASLAFIEPVNCKLTFRLADEDEGISTLDKVNFVCSLTIKSYETMICLIESFCKKRNEFQTYQWLYDLACEIEFLFSPDGAW